MGFVKGTSNKQGESEQINLSTISNTHTLHNPNTLAHHTPQECAQIAMREKCQEKLSQAGEPAVRHKCTAVHRVPLSIKARQKKWHLRE